MKPISNTKSQANTTLTPRQLKKEYMNKEAENMIKGIGVKVLTKEEEEKLAKEKEEAKIREEEERIIAEEIKRIKRGKEIKEKLINKLMKDGKKETITKIVNEVIELNDGWDNVEAIIRKISPQVITKPYKKGATIYNIPTALREEKQIQVGIKWIVEAIRKRIKTGQTCKQSLISEFKDIKNEQGISYKKKIEVYKTALQNRAWLNYRW